MLMTPGYHQALMLPGMDVTAVDVPADQLVITLGSQVITLRLALRFRRQK